MKNKRLILKSKTLHIEVMRNERLYWWKDEKNFGDFASFYLVSHLAKNKIKWAFPQTCIHIDFMNFLRSIKHRRKFRLSDYSGYIFPWSKSMFAIGSIMDFANYKTVVWGSGYREYDSRYKHTKVMAVRGKLSLDKIPQKERTGIALGDPGLLLPLIYDVPQIQSKGVTIIPHFVDYDYFKEKYGNVYEVLDVRTDDLEGMIDKIRQSKFILSSSLHGLIFAHAYGIPALWVKHGYVNSSDFKYYDYFSGVNIPFYNPEVNDEMILKSLQSVKEYFQKMQNFSLVDKTYLVKIQMGLLKSFPFELKDKYKCLINR